MIENPRMMLPAVNSCDGLGRAPVGRHSEKTTSGEYYSIAREGAILE